MHVLNIHSLNKSKNISRFSLYVVLLLPLLLVPLLMITVAEVVVVIIMVAIIIIVLMLILVQNRPLAFPFLHLPLLILIVLETSLEL